MKTDLLCIYAAVQKVPRGKVATYGQIARVAGLPRRARLVGYALGSLPVGIKVPWHRVVNAKGEISPREQPDYYESQRALLEREGVEFRRNGSLSLSRYRWAAGLR